MKSELQEQLIKKYPVIFRRLIQRRRMKKSPKVILPIYFGLEVGDGWYTLIDTLCYQLQHYEKTYGILTIAEQVKEKFGGLRFYISGDLNLKKMKVYKRNGKWHHTWIMNGDVKLRKPEKDFDADRIHAEIHGMISFAESMSYTICEHCGLPGKANDGGWISTQCDKCRGKWEKERAKSHRKYLRQEARRKARRAKFIAKLQALSAEKKAKKIEAAKKFLTGLSVRRHIAGFHYTGDDLMCDCRSRDVLKVLDPGFLQVFDEEERKLDHKILEASQKAQLKK